MGVRHKRLPWIVREFLAQTRIDNPVTHPVMRTKRVSTYGGP